MDKFYIIRTDHSNNDWLYAMTNTLYEAIEFIHDECLYNKDTCIECCKGTFPSNYEVYKTLDANGALK